MKKSIKDIAAATVKKIAPKKDKKLGAYNRPFAATYGYAENDMGDWLYAATNGHVIVLIGKHFLAEELIPQLDDKSVETDESTGNNFHFADRVPEILRACENTGENSNFSLTGTMFQTISKIFSKQLGFGDCDVIDIKVGSALEPKVLVGKGKDCVHVKVIAMPARGGRFIPQDY